MTGEQWQVIAGLVDEWWPGRFEVQARRAWFIALEGFDAQAVTDALKVLLAAGSVHRPSVGEVIGQLRSDPSRPTFDEAYRQIYGPGGVLGFARRGVEISPWVRAFVKRYGQDRLRLLEVDSAEYGEANRRHLRQSWEEFVEAAEQRELAAIASGGRQGGMAQLDPLGALGWKRAELESGGED